MKRVKHLSKQLKFSCPLCQAIYQLIETQELRLKSGNIPLTDNPCLNNCLTKWQDILHNHYQEQIFAHLAQQEQTEDEEENLQNKLDQIKSERKK